METTSIDCSYTISVIYKILFLVQLPTSCLLMARSCTCNLHVMMGVLGSSPERVLLIQTLSQSVFCALLLVVYMYCETSTRAIF
jgi:hypothetical protein